MKFTFKTKRSTGQYRAFYKPSHYIKLKKKVVGSISHDPPHTIRLMIHKKDIMEDGNPNCEWRWLALANKFSSIDEAKTFLNQNVKSILELNLRSAED